MKQIVTIILVILLLVSVGYSQGLSNESMDFDQIHAQEITDFIALKDGLVQKPLDESGVNALIAKGKRIFQNGKFLPKEFKEQFMGMRVGSRGEGSETVDIIYFLNRRAGEYEKAWNHNYVVIVALELDREGRVMDFFWDKPMLSTDKIINSEQLRIFLRYVQQKSFYGMRNKGYELFQKDRILSNEYEVLFEPYFKDEKKGVVRYEFYNYADPSPRVANVFLDIDTTHRKIVNFTGIEAW